MQLRTLWATALFALCCADSAAGRIAPQRRQDSASNTPAPTSQSATSNNQSPSGTTQASQSSKTAKPEDQTTSKESKTSTAIVPNLTTSQSKPTQSSHHNATAIDAQDRLPIKPTITPALGIVGVILMLTGVAYCIIGIKHQWLLVFFSAMYLTSLAVTVLIIYVMHPPVSDGIQAAYMVAALVTGVIFGGISLIFKEVTEGLGCCLGGFCLSMWFLVLKPGGLIASTTGRAIMIGVFSAVGWSLSFSQYTRNYGLIVCTAFGGAMICILGIDCYSRAGLKEFWLYIWDLNPDIFPIHTDTYPITRGIRVEIAGTVVLFLFGVMSQVKIWKIVRERKAKNELAREQEAEQRDQRDLAIGKKVEKSNRRSLNQWEAVYGDKNNVHVHTDSGVGTSLAEDGKKSASVAEREIEMDDMGGIVASGSSQGQRGAVLVRTGTDNGTEDLERGPQELELNLSDPDERAWWDDFRSTKAKSKAATVRSVDESSLSEMLPQDRTPVPGGPDVVPLPFSPIDGARNADITADGSATSNTKSVNERRGVSLNKLALAQLEREEPAHLPRIDDDRASSVAATADFRPDGKRKSMAPTIQIDDEDKSPFGDEFREDVPRIQSRHKHRSLSPMTPGTPGSPATPPEDLVDENDDEVLVRSPTQGLAPPDDSRQRSDTQKRLSTTSSRRGSTGSLLPKKIDDARPVSPPVLEGHLPESISKVAMAFRTNEWAKHIADADQPEYEPLPDMEVDEAGVAVEVGRPAEVSREVDSAALVETVPVAPPPELAVSAKPAFRQSKSTQDLRRQSSNPVPIYSSSRAPSRQTLSRQDSSNSAKQTSGAIKPLSRESRNYSAPISQQPLLEDTVEEDKPHSGPYQSVISPQPSNSNLLDERNTRLSRRVTSTSFNALPSRPDLHVTVPTPEPGANPSGPTTSSNSPTIANPIPNEEDLTLAERKALMQQGVISPTSPIQRSRSKQIASPPPPAAPALGRMNSTTNSALIYDSHQPRRSAAVDTVKQNAMLTQWRQSLQQEGVPKTNEVAEVEARRAMLEQREMAGYRKQKKEVQRQTRESLRDVAMRTGHLTNAHQKAMRRMQAQANKSAME